MFETPVALERNQSGLIGKWQVGEEQATLEQAPGKIIFRFHARDLRLGLRPVPSGKPLRFRFTIDGAPPGSAHGVDTNAQGEGVVSVQRLHQLVRQTGSVADRTFEIEFLEPSLQAFSFTFGMKVALQPCDKRLS